MPDPVQVECVRCGEIALLPPIPDRPGFVGIEPMTGWTAPPPRCPECSRDVAILGDETGRTSETGGSGDAGASSANRDQAGQSESPTGDK